MNMNYSIIAHSKRLHESRTIELKINVKVYGRKWKYATENGIQTVLSTEFIAKSIKFHNLKQFSSHKTRLDLINIEHLAGRSVTEQNFISKHVKFLHDASVNMNLIFHLFSQEKHYRIS